MISLCMIVKDEARFIRHCLESVESVVDEMVVVDTGSTDDTVSIAKGFGARVYNHPWNDSFSEARNFSLSKARGEWILVLDGDEEVCQEDLPIMRSAVTRSDVDGFLVVNINFMPDGGLSKHKNIRLYRNGKVHYEGIVHNEPIVDGHVCDSSIRIYHYGYNLSPEEMAEKYKRSEILLRKQVQEEPKNTFAWANLIRNHRLQKRYEDIIHDGERVLQFSNISLFDKQLITNDLMYAYFVTDRLEQAYALGREGLKDNPNHPDILFTLGGIMIKKRQIQDGIGYFFRYLTVLDSGVETPGLEGLMIDSYGFRGRAWNNIGSGYVDLERFDKAIDAYKNAIEFEKGNIVFYKNLASLYLRMEQFESALRLLEETQDRGIADEVVDRYVGELRLQLHDCV